MSGLYPARIFPAMAADERSLVFGRAAHPVRCGLEEEFASLPSSSDELLGEMYDRYGGIFDPDAYGLAAGSA
jgi:hypothetical protein